MAEAIRARFDKARRSKAIDMIAGLAALPHDNPVARIKAFECLAKHGWPDELKGELAINLPNAVTVQVIHKHVG